MNLQETIRRVLREDRQFSNEFKRRVGGFEAFIWNNYISENPCESESFEDFIKAIYAEIDQLIEVGDGMDGPVSNWLTYEEGVEYVNRFMINDLKKLYDDECDEYEY